jgi:hypothetical protein
MNGMNQVAVFISSGLGELGELGARIYQIKANAIRSRPTRLSWS